MVLRTVRTLLWFFLFSACTPAPKIIQRTLSTERFGELHVSLAEGDPEAAVVYFTSGNPWSKTDERLARAIAARGQVVIGVDTSAYRATLSKDSGSCLFLAGEIERLGQSVQSGLGLKQVHPIILFGAGQGAMLSRTVLAQHPAAFLAGLLHAPEADVSLSLPFCPAEEKAHYTLEVVGTEKESVSDLEIAERINGMVPAHLQHDGEHEALSDLPLRFIAPKKERIGLVIFYSGDGGWASIDKALADHLAKKGFEVVGFDSLKYFWKRKSPERGAEDLVRVLADYSDERLFLGGFSMGAEVLPFIVTKLPPEVRKRVKGMFLLSAGKSADFEIHISDWVGFDDETNDSAIAPQLESVAEMPLCCLSGESDEQSLCAELTPKRALIKKLPGGHHFDGEYEKVGATLDGFLDPLLR